MSAVHASTVHMGDIGVPKRRIEVIPTQNPVLPVAPEPERPAPVPVPAAPQPEPVPA